MVTPCLVVGRARRSPVCVALVVLAAAGLMTGCLGSSRSAADPTHHPVRAAALCETSSHKAEIVGIGQDTTLNNAWANYVSSNKGWTDGDSVYAYAIPKLGTLWTFADSYIGGLLNNGTRVRGIYHNLFVVSNDGKFEVVTGGTAAHRANLVGPRNGPIFYLSLAGIPEGSVFQEILTERLRVGPNSLDNVPVRTVIATFALPSLRLTGTATVGSSVSIGWGAYITRLGGFTYVYGASGGSTVHKNAFVARTSSSNLDSRWSYWDGHAWSPSPAAAAPILAGVQQEYSVTQVDGMYMLVSGDASTYFSNLADVYFGCSPTGPFFRAERFVLSYEVGPMASKAFWGDPEVYVYDAQVQPALSHGTTLVLSYDQNSLNFLSILAHPDINRPHYLDLQVYIPPA